MDAQGWDTRYRNAAESREPRLWAALPPRVFQDEVPGWPPGSALDLACGDGRNAIWLALRGWFVTGVDFSAAAIELSRRHAHVAGAAVTWLKRDVTAWSPATRYDLVTVTYLHLPEDEILRVLTGAAGWVRPGGHLLVLGHDRRNIASGAPGPTDPSILYTPELLRRVVEPARILRCERIERDLATDSESGATDVGHAIDTVLIAVGEAEGQPASPD